MHKLVVLYPEPADRDAFSDYYTNNHLPLTLNLPGVQALRYALDVQALEGEAPYFAVFEADFDSAEAMVGALMSSEGAAIAADVPNYASGGAHLTHYSVTELGVNGRELVLEYLDRWNEQDVDGIVGMFAADGLYTDPSLEQPIGGVDLADHLKQLFAAVPNMALKVTSAAADGPGTALAFWQMSGRVEFPGGASEGEYDLLGGDILHFDSAGKITWTAALYDQKAFLEQSGLAPTP